MADEEQAGFGLHGEGAGDMGVAPRVSVAAAAAAGGSGDGRWSCMHQWPQQERPRHAPATGGFSSTTSLTFKP